MSILLTGPTILALLLAAGPPTDAAQAALTPAVVGKPVRVVSLCF